MQLMKFHKSICLSLTLALSSNLIIQPAQANTLPSWCETKKVAAFTILATAIISFVHLVTKETQPVRVKPRSDSNLDMAWYLFDELLVGQMEKGERMSKVVYNEETEEFDIKYSKIKPRGLAGIIYSKMKPAIIPALTFMLLFNEDVKDKILKGIKHGRDFINDPFISCNELYDAFFNGIYPARILEKPAPIIK